MTALIVGFGNLLVCASSRPDWHDAKPWVGLVVAMTLAGGALVVLDSWTRVKEPSQQPTEEARRNWLGGESVFGYEQSLAIASPKDRVMLHLIHTPREMLLSKRPWSSWREIQDAYGVYVAPLGPWSEQGTIDYLRDEYPRLWPSAEAQIIALMKGGAETVVLTSR